MPVAVSFPGVYVEEIPSGVRTIAGVATSITAFLGRAARGSSTDAVTVTSFAEYERTFGGLHRDFMLGYAVRDFFVNGGAQAVIVRIYKPAEGQAAKASLDVSGLAVEAASEGAWGMKLRARVDKKAATDPNLIAVAQRLGLAPGDLFDLTVRDGGTGVIETFLNLSTKESARRVDRVLVAESSLARVAASVTLPSNTAPAAHTGNLSDADVWTDNGKSSPAKTTPAGTEATDGAALDAAAYKGVIPRLDQADLVNLVCVIPSARGGEVPDDVYQEALSYCAKRRAMLLVDAKIAWTSVSAARTGLGGMNLVGDAARNAAIYFPRIAPGRPAARTARLDTFAPCGVDGRRHRAHRRAARRLEGAGRASTPRSNGVQGLTVNADRRARTASSTRSGINCLRTFPVFGTRGLGRAHAARRRRSWPTSGSTCPVRRLALFIEESLYRGTQVGGVRAERRAAVGADPAERRRVHAQPVPPGRVPGHDAARGVLRQVRQARRRRRTTSTAAS